MERRSTRFDAHRRPSWTWDPITGAQWLCSYWLKRAHKRVSSSFARKLKAYDLIASEWAALREMYRPGRTSPVALATALGMTKGGASKLVDRLVRKGFARKEIGESDRRYRPVVLTGRGKNLVPDLAMCEEDIDRQYFPKEKRRFYLTRALKRVVHAPPEPVYVWDVPGWKPPSAENARYAPDAAPPPSAVASNASNSSDDSSRNLPRDK
jgi:DNA-binding MarR family transcriptional regulator